MRSNKSEKSRALRRCGRFSQPRRIARAVCRRKRVSRPLTPPEPQQLDGFPDVRVTPVKAVLLTVALAAVFAATFLLIGLPEHATGLDLLASFVLGAVLLLLSYIDLRTGLLLDVLTVPLILSGIGFAMISGTSVWASILGAIAGYAVIAMLAYVWRRYRGYEGIGLGDAKLLSASGAWVGVAGLPFVLLIASGIGILMALSVSLKSRPGADSAAIAFGPSLALACWIVWCGIETFGI